MFTRECELFAYIGVLWESKPERTNIIKRKSSHFFRNIKTHEYEKLSSPSSA